MIGSVFLPFEILPDFYHANKAFLLPFYFFSKSAMISASPIRLAKSIEDSFPQTERILAHSGQFGHRIRSMPSTDSGACRPVAE